MRVFLEFLRLKVVEVVLFPWWLWTKTLGNKAMWEATGICTLLAAMIWGGGAVVLLLASVGYPPLAVWCFAEVGQVPLWLWTPLFVGCLIIVVGAALAVVVVVARIVYEWLQGNWRRAKANVAARGK